MKKFTVPTIEDAKPASKVIFHKIEKDFGFLPNIYAFLGHAPNTLANFLQLRASNSAGSFNERELEAIYLAVSQENESEYCIAVHTFMGKNVGFNSEETVQLRVGNHPEKKLSILSSLAREIQKTHGEPNDELLNEFFDLGYDEAALVELVALVMEKSFVNYLQKIAKLKLDFPEAPRFNHQAGSEFVSF